MGKTYAKSEREIEKTRFVLDDVNGSTAEFVLLTATEPITLVRIIEDLIATCEAVSGATQDMHWELWIKRKGQALPATFPLTGLITYGDNLAFCYRRNAAFMRETTSANGTLDRFRNIKIKRKLKRDDEIVFRTVGNAFVVLNGNLSMFCLE